MISFKWTVLILRKIAIVIQNSKPKIYFFSFFFFFFFLLIKQCRLDGGPEGSVTPYRKALSDVRRRTKFSIRSSASACVSCPFFIRRCPFLIRRIRSLLGEVRSVRRKILCMFKTWNRLNLKKAPAGCTVAMRWHALFETRALLVLYLSTSHPLMPDGPDSRPDHYLTCNGSTADVPDTDRMFSGRLLTRNVWKLTNNERETVVHGTKLMTYTWQNFQLHRF